MSLAAGARWLRWFRWFRWFRWLRWFRWFRWKRDFRVNDRRDLGLDYRGREGVEFEEELASAHGAVFVSVEVGEDTLGEAGVSGFGLGDRSDVAKLGEGELSVLVEVDFIETSDATVFDGLADFCLGGFAFAV
ncbi:MAG: hypothetical protein ACJAQT_003831 [Akkermansiaceae bacterium]|jgi:hypothetical protein